MNPFDMEHLFATNDPGRFLTFFEEVQKVVHDYDAGRVKQMQQICLIVSSAESGKRTWDALHDANTALS